MIFDIYSGLPFFLFQSPILYVPVALRSSVEVIQYLWYWGHVQSSWNNKVCWFVSVSVYMYNKGLGKGPVTKPKLPITYNSSCCNILFLSLMTFWYDPFDLQDWTWRVSLENHPVKYWSVRSRVGLMQVRHVKPQQSERSVCLCLFVFYMQPSTAAAMCTALHA